MNNYYPDYCTIGGSPIYHVTSGDVINATNGWPAGMDLPLFPPCIYANGQELDLSGPGTLFIVPNYGIYATWNYSGFGITQDTDVNGNISYWCQGSAAGYQEYGSAFSFNNFYASGMLYISGTPPSWPVYGPPEILVGGRVYYYSYNNPSIGDIYGAGSGYGDMLALSGQNLFVYDAALCDPLIATYNPNTYQFTVVDHSTDDYAWILNYLDLSTITALDPQGNLMGSGTGVVIQGMPWGSGTSLQFGNGTFSSASCLSACQKVGGDSWVRFTGIAQNTLFVIQDGNGNYSSPVYRYAPTLNKFTISAVNGLPGTNIYPDKLFVNGIEADRDDSTLYDTNNIVNRNGYVTYHVPASVGAQYTGIVNLNWTWGTIGFTGTMTGSYGAFSSFSSSWDGYQTFGSLPAGLVISTQEPPQSVRYGPGAIKWNGVNLIFNPLDSSVYANNPTGADVYEDNSGLGLMAKIEHSGNVALYNGTVCSGVGTYSLESSQFNFGSSSVGSVSAETGSGSVVRSADGSGGPSVSGAGGSEVLGDFDIRGSSLTLGTWLDIHENSVSGLSVFYSDGGGTNPSLLTFASSRKSINWVWSHPQADEGSTQVTTMKLDSKHRLILYDPADPTKQPIILDPGGKSHIEQD